MMRKAVFIIMGSGMILGGIFIQQFSDRPSNRQESDKRHLAAVDAVADYCREYESVIADIPRHPRSQEVVGRIVDIWSKDKSIGKQAATEDIVRGFKNSPVGLAALNSLADTAPARLIPFYEELVQMEPDSRVACMAVDRLVQLVPDKAGYLLEKLVAEKPGTRVGVFGLTLQGNRANAQGDADLAAECWLKAWIADPNRSTPLFNKLTIYWLETGDWYYPLLMPEGFREDPALLPVKEHALAALHDEGPPASLRTLVQSGGKALQMGNIATAVAALRQAVAQSANARPEDKACYGVAVFLLGAKNYRLMPVLKTSLEAKRELQQCREQCLKWAQAGLPSLPKDLQACYALQIAKRRSQDGQIPAALNVLNAAWQETQLAPWLRESLLNELLTLLVEENAAYADAARMCIAYCKESPPSETKYRLRAAELFYQAQDYALSLDQLDKLTQARETEELLPAVKLLQSMNYLDQGNVEEGMRILRQVISDHPQDALAAEALSLAAKASLASGDAKTATAFYEELKLRFPETLRAKEAQNMLEQLDKQK